jgi:DNA-binding NarL/FixJ family response regulator
MNIKVAIVEDTEDIRKGLTHLINAYPDFECGLACANASEALELLPKYKPDVVLMDINMPGMNGIECIKILKPQFPAIQFLMATVYEGDEMIFESLKAGATGYITKNTPPAKLLDAIREIHNGGSPMGSTIARKVINQYFAPKTIRTDLELSTREREILELLSQGLQYKQIADKIFISTETVRTHIRNIYEKLQVHCKEDAIKIAFGN